MPAPQASPQPAAPARAASDTRNPLLVVAVVLAVVAGLASFVAIVTFISIANDLTKSSEVRLARLEAAVAAKTAASSPASEPEPVPAARTFSHFGYRFDLPSGWQTDLTGSGAVFSDSAGVTLARLSCPPPETGYESWKFEELKRETAKNGRAYEFRLLLGTPDVELYGQDVKDLGDLNILFLSRMGESQADWNASCQLISWSAAGASDADFRRIYSSVGLE